MKRMIGDSLKDSIVHGIKFEQYGSWWILPATVKEQHVVFSVMPQLDWETLVDQALASQLRRARRVLDVRYMPVGNDSFSLPPGTDPATAGELLKAEIILEIWDDWFDLTLSFRDPKCIEHEIYLLRKRCCFVRLVLWAIPRGLIENSDPSRPGFIIGVRGRDPGVEAMESAVAYFPLGESRLALVDDDWKEILWTMVVEVFGLGRQYGDRSTVGPVIHVDQTVWDEVNRVCETGMMCEGGMSDIP